MRVLLISDEDYKYGSYHSMLQLLRAGLFESTRDVKFTVLTKHTGSDEYDSYTNNVVRLNYGQFYNEIPYIRWRYPIKYVIKGVEYALGRVFTIHQIKKNIDMVNIDIIHINSSRVDLGAEIAEKYHKPLIWHLREFGDKDFKCYFYRKNYIEYMNCHTSKFVAISNAVKESWSKKGLDSTKIQVVYNSVDEVPVGKKTSPFIFKIVMCGSVNESKRQKELIEAVSLLNPDETDRIRIDIVGDGNLKYTEELRQLIENRKLTKIVALQGYIDDINRKLKDYDIGVMCSRCEAFGRVTAEYMMAGLVVIASDTGANPELIHDKVDGFLYESGSASALRDCIRLVINNPQSLSEISSNARKTAYKKFSTETYCKEIVNIYKEALNQTR